MVEDLQWGLEPFRLIYIVQMEDAAEQRWDPVHYKLFHNEVVSKVLALKFISNSDKSGCLVSV